MDIDSSTIIFHVSKISSTSSLIIRFMLLPRLDLHHTWEKQHIHSEITFNPTNALSIESFETCSCQSIPYLFASACSSFLVSFFFGTSDHISTLSQLDYSPTTAPSHCEKVISSSANPINYGKNGNISIDSRTKRTWSSEPIGSSFWATGSRTSIVHMRLASVAWVMEANGCVISFVWALVRNVSSTAPDRMVTSRSRQQWRKRCQTARFTPSIRIYSSVQLMYARFIRCGWATARHLPRRKAGRRSSKSWVTAIGRSTYLRSISKVANSISFLRYLRRKREHFHDKSSSKSIWKLQLRLMNYSKF